MEILDFSGGLNYIVAPHLIASNESRELSNIDVNSGAIRPAKSKAIWTGQVVVNGAVVVSSKVAENFYYFNGIWISGRESRNYVEYNRRLYYSNGRQAKWTSDGITFSDLGTNTPTDILVPNERASAFTATVASGGTLGIGTRNYKIVSGTDVYTVSKDITVVGSKVTFSFTSAVEYRVYGKWSNETEYITVDDPVTGPGSITDGSAVVAPSITVTESVKITHSVEGEFSGITKLNGLIYGTQQKTPRYKVPSGITGTKIYDATQNKFIADNNVPGQVSGYTVGDPSPLPNTYGPVGTIYSPTGLHSQYLNLGGVLHMYVTDLYSDYVTNIFRTHLAGKDGILYKLVSNVWTPVNYNLPALGRARRVEDGLPVNDAMLVTAVAFNLVYFFDLVGGRFQSFASDGTAAGGACPVMDNPLSSTAVKFDGTQWLIFELTPATEFTAYSYKIYSFTPGSSGKSLFLDLTSNPDVTVAPQGGLEFAQADDRTNGLIRWISIQPEWNQQHKLFELDTATKAVTVTTLVTDHEESVTGLITDGTSIHLITNVNDEYVLSSLDTATQPHYGKIWTYTQPELVDRVGSPLPNVGITGTYTYLFTYSDIGGANESGPSNASDAITVSRSNIEFNNLDAIANPDLKARFRIYRIGGDLSKYTLVAEIPSTDTSYIDYQSDVAISANGVIGTIGEGAAPQSIKFLTEHLGRLWGAASEADGYTKLYFSQLGDPQVWGATDFIQLPAAIHGIGGTAGGLIIFTFTETWVLLGNDPSNFALRLVSSEHGCTQPYSINYREGNLIYVTEGKILLCNGSSVKVLSEHKVNLPSHISDSALHDSKYYLLDWSGNMWIMDFKLGGAIYKHTSRMKGLGNFLGAMYFSDGENLYYENREVTKETMAYTSPKYIDGELTNQKEYEKIRLSGSGTATVTVSIGGTVYSKYIALSGSTRITLPNGKNKGYSIQFGLRGTFSLDAINYTVKGRSSGS